jgi:nucleoside-diphosphate-sugar epimerase
MGGIAVTGASGFIGRHVVTSLARRGAAVLAIGRGSAPAWLPKSVVWHSADILSGNLDGRVIVDDFGCDHLVHLAWITTPQEYWTSPENVVWERASLALISDFAQAGGKRVLAAGTCAEYCPPEEGPCDPLTTPISPRELYSSSKTTVHQSLSNMAARDNLSFAWARIFFLYGPHENPDRLVPSITRRLLHCEEAPCSHGQQIRDFLHVRDCGEALAATALSGLTGALNISSGRPVRLLEIFSILGEITGQAQLLRIGARPFNSAEPPNLWGSAERLRNEVGFEPVYDLVSGLHDAVAYWRDFCRNSG